MIANCPNFAAGAKTVAFTTGKSAAGSGACGGAVGCCKAAGGAFLGHGIMPIVIVGVLGFVAYKAYHTHKEIKELQKVSS